MMEGLFFARKIRMPLNSHLVIHWGGTARKDVDQLVTLVAGQNIDDRTVEITFPHNPDGKYFLKGGTPAVWDAFGLPGKWRSKLGEGVIEGKRCGITQNLGPATRERRRQHQRRQVIA
jgi:hypothetical protein